MFIIASIVSYGSSFVYVAFGSAELQPWNSPPVDCGEESNINHQGKSFSTSRSELWMMSFKQHIQNPKAHPFNFSFRTFGRYRRHGDIFHIVLNTTIHHMARQICVAIFTRKKKRTRLLNTQDAASLLLAANGSISR